jgi:hypothetical protein
MSTSCPIGIRSAYGFTFQSVFENVCGTSAGIARGETPASTTRFTSRRDQTGK